MDTEKRNMILGNIDRRLATIQAATAQITRAHLDVVDLINGLLNEEQAEAAKKAAKGGKDGKAQTPSDAKHDTVRSDAANHKRTSPK